METYQSPQTRSHRACRLQVQVAVEQDGGKAAVMHACLDRSWMDGKAIIGVVGVTKE